MQARRLARSLFLLLWVTLIGMHPLMGAPELAPARSSADQQSFISGPRQSLPLPVHDEATCAFCQAAAFAPHAAGPADKFLVVAGEEQQVQLSQDSDLTPSGTARPPRSRAPPVFRSV